MRRARISDQFRRVAHRVAVAMGLPWAFAGALLVVLVWAMTGVLFDYSEGWQLSINTGTTIVTFLMVFLIQNTQNRDSQVVQLKLDELIRAVRAARNELVELEDLPDDELERLHGQFRALRQAALQRALTSPTDAAVGAADVAGTRKRRLHASHRTGTDRGRRAGGLRPARKRSVTRARSASRRVTT